MIMNSKRGFTLTELIVSIAMMAILMASLTYAVKAAQERARIQKALADVKAITQAILGYEQYAERHELPQMDKRECDATSLKFLIGDGDSARGGKLPVLLQAALSTGGKMIDPWGNPYYVTIREGGNGSIESPFTSLTTCFAIPNFYRLSKEERSR